MHLFDPDAGVLISVPIVGASIPIGVGAAFAMKYKGTEDVTVVYLGDAAVEEGVFHESANFATLHRLPVVFVCENNLYSVHTPLRARQPERSIADLARAHGLYTQQVDGNDVFEVRHASAIAVAQARSGAGASFILADTYRWRAHVGPNHDDTRPEFESWKVRDPLRGLNVDIATVQKITTEIDEAFEFAEAAPFPDPKTVGEHVYAG